MRRPAMMAELSAEFAAAAVAAERQHFDDLVGRGVANSFLWRGATRFGVAEIVVDGELYQPMPGGELAFIVPVMPLAAPWEPGFPVDDVGDLVAWLPEDPTRWWRRRGLDPILNPAAVERAAWFREPLAVWSTPLAWLRAGGAGIVLLDREANLRLWLGGVDIVHAEALDLGEQIERRLRDPRALPRVLVPEPAAAG